MRSDFTWLRECKTFSTFKTRSTFSFIFILLGELVSEQLAARRSFRSSDMKPWLGQCARKASASRLGVPASIYLPRY